MSLESDIQVLRQVPLFQQFGDDQLRLLAFSAETKRFKDGAQLFSLGDRADGGYVVADGRVGLTELRNGRQEVVHRLKTGQLIGQYALLVETTHASGAIALSELELIHIRRTTFRRVLDEYPDVAVRLRAVFAEQLVQMNAELKAVGEKFGG